ncbi:hypothetical protein NDU88_008309 [Pleurodeles waltl]|uniref:Uncharacterized protein n=1 Tax=Pleurodeles waltl TaxID=8319 RepID=A0AAV7NXG3_PLEWA|nr:hypothetical protein NDU88_008309 [Pleurodeles waltl]
MNEWGRYSLDWQRGPGAGTGQLLCLQEEASVPEESVGGGGPCRLGVPECPYRAAGSRSKWQGRNPAWGVSRPATTPGRRCWGLGWVAAPVLRRGRPPGWPEPARKRGDRRSWRLRRRAPQKKQVVDCLAKEDHWPPRVPGSASDP